jgi:hypothetical protein
MRIWRISAIVASMFLSGCATTYLSGRLQLPANARIVGGGLSIEWTAPAKGTVILVETGSGKIVRTQSVDEGDTFTFDPLLAENTELLNRMFGGPEAKDSQALAPLPTVTRFVLYFVPETTQER